MKNIIYLNGFVVEDETENEIRMQIKKRLKEIIENDDFEYETEDEDFDCEIDDDWFE